MSRPRHAAPWVWIAASVLPPTGGRLVRPGAKNFRRGGGNLRMAQARLETRSQSRERKTEREVDRGRHAVDFERAQRAFDRLLRGARELEHADDGGEGRVLDEDPAKPAERRQH